MKDLGVRNDHDFIDKKKEKRKKRKRMERQSGRQPTRMEGVGIENNACIARHDLNSIADGPRGTNESGATIETFAPMSSARFNRSTPVSAVSDFIDA